MLKSNAGGASNGERMGRLLIAYWRFIPAIAVTWLLVKPGVEGRINPAATGFFALIASVAVMMLVGVSRRVKDGERWCPVSVAVRRRSPRGQCR